MIKFNEVTWYSKLAAVIFLLGIFPMLTFYIGMKYQEAQNIPQVTEVPFIPRTHDAIPEIVPVATSTPEISNANELHVGQRKNINGIEVTFNSIIQDSRCPVDVQCIQAGNVTANVTLQSYDMVTIIQMVSNQIYTFDAHSISIVKVSPTQTSKTPISPKEYILGFKVEKI
jgi:hypothetical protein